MSVAVAAPRLDEICAVHGLDAGQRAQLGRLLETLASDPLAPTAITRAAQAVDVHVADSLTALELGCVRSAGAIADIGSGPGFPGLALAVALPGATVTLVESASRKCSFIERAAAAAALGNVRVVAARVEEWTPRLQDVVTARAVGPLAVLCEYAAPLLALGGALVAWRGQRDADGEAAAARAAAILGLEPAVPVRCEPYAGSLAHHLHVYTKTAPTPARFPRRAGIARKRPLGALGR